MSFERGISCFQNCCFGGRSPNRRNLLIMHWVFFVYCCFGGRSPNRQAHSSEARRSVVLEVDLRTDAGFWLRFGIWRRIQIHRRNSFKNKRQNEIALRMHFWSVFGLIWVPNGWYLRPSGKQKGAISEPRGDQNASENRSSEKVAKKGAKSGDRDLFLDPFFGPKIVKIAIFENIRVLWSSPERSKARFFWFFGLFFRPQFWDRFLMDFWRKRVPKWCQNGCQNRWNFDAISEPAISCFLQRVFG